MISNIEDAFAAHLPGAWTGDVAWQGRPYDPAADAPYLSVSLMAHTRQTLGYGVNAVRQWRGAWQAAVVMPASIGKRTANDTAWSIASHYKRGTVFASLPGLQITNTDIRPAYTDSDFIRVPVIVEWFLMETTTP